MQTTKTFFYSSASILSSFSNADNIESFCEISPILDVPIFPDCSKRSNLSFSVWKKSAPCNAYHACESISRLLCSLCTHSSSCPSTCSRKLLHACLLLHIRWMGTLAYTMSPHCNSHCMPNASPGRICPQMPYLFHSLFHIFDVDGSCCLLSLVCQCTNLGLHNQSQSPRLTLAAARC